MSKNKKNRKNIVYSTNPNHSYEYEEEEDEETLLPGEQNLQPILTENSEKEKQLPLLDFIGSTDDLKELGKH